MAFGNVRYAFSKLNSKTRFIDLSLTGLQEHSTDDNAEKIRLLRVREFSNIQLIFELPAKKMSSYYLIEYKTVYIM